MKLISPVPNDFVLRTFVVYLILEDIIASRSISIFIKSDRCTRAACKD